MPCFRCNGKSQFYQRLDRARLRFMRKVYPNFSESNYLCMRCFEKFESIFKSKKKSKPNSSINSSVSVATIRTVSSKSNSKDSSQSALPPQVVSSKENTQSNGSPILKFFSYSATSSDGSIDSTDRLVRKTTEIPSLTDSSKVTHKPDIIIAREAARAAERSALRRKRTREDGSPQTPTGRHRANVPMPTRDIEDDIEEIRSILEPNDLALVRPIVKKRKEPVVYLNQDIMDIYLANTSGG